MEETQTVGDIGIHDDIGKEIEADYKAQIEREIAMFKENLDQIAKEKENFEKQWKIDEELWEMQLAGNNIERVKPERNIDLIPRYWELQREKLQYKYRSDKQLAESHLKGYEHNAKQINENLDSLYKKLADLEGVKDGGN